LDSQGKNVLPAMKNPSAVVETGALSFHNGIALRTKDYACMRCRDGIEELYDMKKDPEQFSNEAANPEYLSVLKQVRKQFDLHLKEEGIFDKKTRKYKQNKYETQRF
jgi:hypothetical protein